MNVNKLKAVAEKTNKKFNQESEEDDDSEGILIKSVFKSITK